ncbi:hypothetical protein [Rhodoferax antarcticus]|uniref:hypothetical protein n=1 Tax=Rhodoferax antarcticus TaxID=81479 RepID=UPI00094FD83B|nr:hypothetical protein [Rhodoferax antarcticus]
MTTELQYGYTQHTKFDLDGFSVVDATSVGPRPHDDLIWIGFNGYGRWVTPLDAVAYSRAIQDVVAAHCERRGIAAVAATNQEKL